jgi:hypothetical protein
MARTYQQSEASAGGAEERQGARKAPRTPVIENLALLALSIGVLAFLFFVCRAR